jgi:translation initiation factor eIF-2B subunit delta
MIDETVAEIERMQTHSSSVVAVKAAEALRELFDREYPTVEEYVRDLERNSNALRRANPSHASLHTSQREVVETVAAAAHGSVAEAIAHTGEVIDRVVDDVQTGKQTAAEAAATRLEDGTTLLTHDYSTTLLEAIRLAVADGKEFKVYVTEARPRYLGRKAVRTLAELDGVEPHLLVDAAAGHVLRECDAAMFGMTCIVDDVYYNRIGTFPTAACANELDVPVHVVGSGSKIIDRGGFSFENEFRTPVEVMREPAEGFDIENPAYDATPLRLVDRLVTDHGTRTP